MYEVFQCASGQTVSVALIGSLSLFRFGNARSNCVFTAIDSDVVGFEVQGHLLDNISDIFNAFHSCLL